MKKIFFFGFLALFTLLSAEEGMFLPFQIQQAELYQRLQQSGLELKAEEIFSFDEPALAQAIVNLGGGTGSFVSANGLILTNHHVAFGAVQRQSTPEKNYIRDGFLAKTLQEEIPAPGYRARIVVQIRNVTSLFTPLIKKKSNPLKIYEQIELLKKKLIRDAERKPGIEAVVAEYFGGKEFFLIHYLTLKDIRIVYIPTQSIGEYGGEIDNWMWPRHTGDFSFLRAYIGKDGKPSYFNPENVPYRPQVYLKMASQPLREGDLTLIMGYPGSTSRFKCAADVENTVNYFYPERIRLIQGWIDVLEKASTDEATRIKNSGVLKGLYNSIKNNRGMLEGLLKFKVAELKRADEQKLKASLASTSRQSSTDFLNELEKIAAENLILSRRSQLLSWMNRGVRALSWALTINKLAIEREKPDLKRESGYQQRDLPQIVQNFKIAQNSFDLKTDKLVLNYFLQEFLKVAPPNHFLIEEINRQQQLEISAKISAFIEELYSRSKIYELDYRQQLLEKKLVELLKIEDPFLKIASRLQSELDQLQQETRRLSIRRLKVEPLYNQALATTRNLRPAYPDANGTLRFSYGTVKGYQPRDAVYYKPFSTLSGVIEKNTDQFPFNLDSRIIKSFQQKDFGKYVAPELNDLPVNFLTTNDSTGGNSGSPVLNARGELVGLLFDGNYEAMCSDYLFIDELTRSIHVDLRYILYITEKIDQAENVLNELSKR